MNRTIHDQWLWQYYMMSCEVASLWKSTRYLAKFSSNNIYFPLSGIRNAIESTIKEYEKEES